ncbi:hypothetical protein Gura_3456 [Geotalea uraniireducens Rf4]|uniref:Uncharacterized protein n=1 Tax=Geotalea uraniireducens (strain Rf4) TaxID=351605 RepID=A5G744_GEOUR|nr:hypothetical protein Gura_3456 [Geotalea uraniireducens Rf4]
MGPAQVRAANLHPPFPEGAYFSEAGLIGPVNFIDLNPSLGFHGFSIPLIDTT